MRNRIILITGLPHSGKSTLMKRLLDNVESKQGFITLEILENGQRVGFKIVTAGGSEAVLASVEFETPIRVSKYGVSVSNLEKILPECSNFEEKDVLYIDEIGQMELYSLKFKELVLKYLDSGNLVIATVSKIYSDDFTQMLLSRGDVNLFEITPENRDRVYEEIRGMLFG